MKVVFMGTPEFSVPALRALIRTCEVVAVYTQPDKAVGRGLQVTPTPVKKVALEHGLPVFTPEKVSIPEEIERIKSYAPDFIVVVAYGQILKLPVIETPKYDTINIHSSLLPRWRGAAPIHWALLAGDEETGITTMKIVPKLDAGDMLMQGRTRIASDDTTQTLHDRLAEMGADLIVKTLDGVMEGSIRPEKQDEGLVTYAHKLTKEMENLDWTKTASEIDRAVRALNPWPGTRVCTTSGLKLKIKKGKPFRSTIDRGGPGRLIENMGSLYVTCAQSAYEIFELQEEGKRSMAVHDFMNGLKGRGIALPLDLVMVPSAVPLNALATPASGGKV
ncbi:MAG: methionyl-tRNA formyltransferase [Bdellovibrionales bacterium]|nr:methionyl-tRNA formyltransferase [Bdellovibrionales bacterium]